MKFNYVHRSSIVPHISSSRKLLEYWRGYFILKTSVSALAGDFFSLKPKADFGSQFFSTMSGNYNNSNMRKSNSQNENKSYRNKKIEQPRHVKYRAKVGGNLPSSSKIEVVVIGSGGRGTATSVMIVTDVVRYLFNCGEGTQRIATEHRSKLSRLENIFITQKTWNNVGGFLGMALTLANTGLPAFTVHGPPGIERMVHLARSFADTEVCKVEKRDVRQGFYRDDVMLVDYVQLFPENYGGETNAAEPNTDESNTGEKSDGNVSEQRYDKDMVVAYICSPHIPKAKLDMEKCVELNVPAGPLLRVLKDERPVTLEDGTVVHPDQVLQGKESPKSIIVLECPTVDYIDSFLKCKKFQMKSTNEKRLVDIVVHMTPASVIEHPQYKQFISSFGDDTNHMILNESCNEVCLEGVLRNQTKLNMLHPLIFPELHQQKLTTQAVIDGRIAHGCTNFAHIFRGVTKGFNSDGVVSLNKDLCLKAAFQAEGVEDSLTDLKNKLATHPVEDSQPYPEIIFLGTGSSVPNKTRNVSGILVHVSEDSSILLDCGEGTAGQLYRHYGDKTDEILRKLKGIYISHMHADHHLGLFGVIEDYRKSFLKSGMSVNRLIVLGPIQMLRWINFYNKEIEPLWGKISFISLQKLLKCSEGEIEEFPQFMNSLNLKQFLPVFVKHIDNSFGIVIEHADGWKLVYSGDTMPCEKLVQAGENCDILIHEASMEDDLVEEAAAKTHSTTSQAIKIGKDMKAKHIMLNHFSQRYAKLPIITEQMSDVGIAFDHMKVTRNDIPLIPLFYNTLKLFMADDYAKLELKNQKRTFKKEREEKSKKRKQEEEMSADNKQQMEAPR